MTVWAQRIEFLKGVSHGLRIKGDDEASALMLTVCDWLQEAEDCIGIVGKREEDTKREENKWDILGETVKKYIKCAQEDLEKRNEEDNNQ